MSRSFLQKERQKIFRDLTRQYQQDGYDNREAKKMAKKDTDDIMSDKETFVDNYIQDTWGDIDDNE
tara:strand:- start:86 stop:283 length:198 start_codon:yes stop_codon:yes gene_type:complete